MIPPEVLAWLNRADLEANELLVEELEGDEHGIAVTYEESQHLRKFAAQLVEIANKVEDKVARAVDGQILLDGKLMRPTTSVSRRNWQNDDLLRAVLDSRVVDKVTGEVKDDETPLEKVRAVYPLSGSSARITALRTRDIDADEYCDVEWGRRRLIPVR